MNKKSLLLLLIFTAGLFPVYPVKAEESSTRTVEEAVSFMYISDAILTDETEIDDSTEAIGMLSLAQSKGADVDTNPLWADMIHAKKMQRNDLDANCRLLKAYYIGQGKDCEANEVAKYCQTKRAEINSQIGYFHKMRGDQRKFFTRMWHSMKRNSSNFWYKIGPLGRRILRSVGDEALQMAVSGGFSGGAIKNLLKQTAKSMGRDHLKQVLLQGVQRLLQGQMDIAAAAGVDICEEDPESLSEVTETQTEERGSPDFKLPDNGIWQLSCQHTWETVIEDYDFVIWEVDIDFDSRTFEGFINGSDTNIDGYRTEVWSWVEETSGYITEDGFLWGDTDDTSTLSWSYEGGGNSGSEDRFYMKNWIGAISADLSKVCFTRVGAREWLTIDWIRERGRLEMLDHPGGLCEASCSVH